MAQSCNRKRAPSGRRGRPCRPLDGLLDAAVFRALSDPMRLRLLAAVAQSARPCGVGEAAECCPVDLSVVSRHLSTLARAGLLEAEKRGRRVAYHVRFDAVVDMLRTLADALEACCPGSPNRPAGSRRSIPRTLRRSGP